MSATISNPQPQVRDTLIAEAHNLPELIVLAHVNDPQLAASLTEKPLLYSRTIWAPPIVALITVLAARYGLDLDGQTTAIIAGGLIWATTVAIRVVTRSPIGSVLPVTTP